jgi:hypothetical protein
MQESCTVCAECTIGSQTFLTHPMELVYDVGYLEPRFGPFGDGVSVIAR